MSLQFMGDVFLQKPFKVELPLDRYIINLEYPLSTKGEPAQGKINLGADTPYLKETFGKNPIAVNLANNHIMDYGEEGFEATIAYLEREGILFFGAGKQSDNFNNPVFIEMGGKRIALMGYSCPTTHAVFGTQERNGSAMLTKELVLRDIDSARKEADFVIVNLHWGEEEISYPKPSDVILAHSFIDAGADLIIGHHAHVIQSFEKYKGKYIFYGLGNFIFPDIKVPALYDGEKFNRLFEKPASKENKEALIVSLNEDFAISYQTALFDGKSVRLASLKLPRWIPQSERAYQLYYLYWARKTMIQRFIQNPRLPTWRHLKLILGIGK